VCARGDGIRGSKDLRAGLRKYLRPTIERKKMSKKTNFKRIALVAVASLGFGVFTSIAPANAADVESTDISISTTVSTAIGSVGVCYVSNTANAGKATITTAASLVFEATTGHNGYFKVVSGPAAFTAIGTSNTITSAGDKVSFTGVTGSATLKASAVGTVKVSGFTPSDVVVETYTITVVAKCGGDSLSVADSYYRAVATSSVTAGLVTTNVDDSGSTDVATKGYSYIALDLRDAYGQPLSTAGALIATATNGALVNIDSDTAGTAVTAVKATTAGSTTYVRVDTPTAGTPVTTAVSVTFNGAAVVTKTITLRGYAKSIEVTDVTVGLSGASLSLATTAGAGTFLYRWKDSAGNVVPGGAVQATAATGLTTLVTAASGGTNAAGPVSRVGGTAGAAAASPTTTSGATSYGDGKYTCTGSTKSGSAKIAVAGLNAALDTIVSNVFTATCGGALDTWTISTDKASYAPGEIGTLTVTGKDANGAMVTDIAALTGVSGSATIGGGATWVTAPANTDTFTSGVKTYKFLVGNTVGSYAASLTITGDTDTAAKTLQYKVASSGTTVTNEDILKSIVSLIASINKQIQALQKLILKR
jgi:hypothetical protein